MHVRIVSVGYAGSDFWEGAVLIDSFEVEFHPAGKKNYGGSAAGLTRKKAPRGETKEKRTRKTLNTHLIDPILDSGGLTRTSSNTVPSIPTDE